MLKQIINQDDAPETVNEGGDNPPQEIAPSFPKSKPAVSSSLTGSRNILSSDVEIRGKLRFSNDLIIDGRIEGEVNSEGDLTVGENATVVGDIKTRSVVVFGRVEGNITVTDRCELKQNAELHGDVVAGKLAIEEGATFMGSSTVGTPKSGSFSKNSDDNPAPEGGGDSE